jgi:hypothetical protein
LLPSRIEVLYKIAREDFSILPLYSPELKCTGYGADLGGESPLRAVETGSASRGKGVHREMESEES